MEDFKGRVYTRLTVLEFSHHNKHLQPVWKCECVCKKIRFVPSGDLRSGHTKSCGCLSADSLRKIAYKHGEGGVTKEYTCWRSMKQRCLDKKCDSYQDYGGRGITVCSEWLNSYQQFLKDMGRKPSETHSIDRINNDGNYEPSNCKWSTPKEQCNNKRPWGSCKKPGRSKKNV